MFPSEVAVRTIAMKSGFGARPTLCGPKPATSAMANETTKPAAGECERPASE